MSESTYIPADDYVWPGLGPRTGKPPKHLTVEDAETGQIIVFAQQCQCTGRRILLGREDNEWSIECQECGKAWERNGEMNMNTRERVDRSWALAELERHKREHSGDPAEAYWIRVCDALLDGEPVEEPWFWIAPDTYEQITRDHVGRATLLGPKAAAELVQQGRQPVPLYLAPQPSRELETRELLEEFVVKSYGHPVFWELRQKARAILSGSEVRDA